MRNVNHHVSLTFVALLCSVLQSAGSSRPDSVRVGIYDNLPKIAMTADGRAVGLFPDLLRYIARQESWTLVYVPGTWEKCLERLEAGSIDIMPDVALSKERALKYDFSGEAVLSNWGVVYTRDDHLIESFTDLEGRVVALMRGSIHSDGAKELLSAFGVNCRFRETGSYAAVLADVRDGRAQAGVVNRLFGSLHEREYGVVPTSLVFGVQHLHFAFRKGSQRSQYLIERIDRHVRALKAEPGSAYNRAIQNYLTGSEGDWAGGDMFGKVRSDHEGFTDAEKAWIAAHSRIRVGIDPSYIPYQFFDEQGNFGGVAADAVKLLNDRCGLSMEAVNVGTWSETLEKARAGQIDVMAAMARSSERARHFLFSRPYLRLPLVVVTRREYPLIHELADLEGARIAVARGHLAGDLLQQRFATSELVSFDDLGEAVTAVSKGQADALIQPISVVEYFERRMGITNLRVSATTPYSYDICFAVRKDWPTLLTILDKGLSRIGATERELILSKWLSPRIERQVDWSKVAGWIALVVAVAVSIITVVLVVNRRLAAEVDRRKKIEVALKEADRLKSAFLATMSHELRTPLNSIIGFTGIILQGLVGDLTDEQRKQLGMVRDSAHHLLALINDVLDISKIEAGQLEIRPEQFFLTHAIEQSIRVVTPLAEKKSLPIAFEAPQESISMSSDRRRVEQVLINLLNNAVKFTEQGAITVRVQRGHKGAAGSAADESAVRIVVRDTGIGIAPGDLTKLFQPFQQLDMGTTRRYEGTGLGLSICKKLSRMLGGDIEARSDGLGKGSTFIFTLPSSGV